MTDLTLPGIVLAGLLSFLSPCVLPLVPPYLAYMAGMSVSALTTQNTVGIDGVANGTALQKRVVLTALCFVLGFSTVFILLGAGASSMGRVLRIYSDWLAMAAGVMIIIMGLHFLGVFRLMFLYREARLDVRRPASFSGAYLMGLAFAFGWTPCIGPVLGSVMAVAGAQASVTRGMGLLALYAAGLGIPFMLAAVFLGPFTRLLAQLKSHMGMIEKVMGGLLVLTGLAFLSGGMATAAFWILETFPALGRLG